MTYGERQKGRKIRYKERWAKNYFGTKTNGKGKDTIFDFFRVELKLIIKT